jgi:hypothetical protein
MFRSCLALSRQSLEYCLSCFQHPLVFFAAESSGRRVLALVLLATAGVAFAQDSTDPRTAALLGAVSDERGNPVRGVRVSAARVSGAKLAEPFGYRFAISGSSGGFELRNLPAGLYQLCAVASGGELLNPCEWSSNPPAAIVQPGQIRSDVSIVLRRGKAIQVRIDDLDKKFKRGPKGSVDEPVAVWLVSPAGIHAVPVMAEDADGVNFSIAVPFQTPLQLDVRSGRFDLKGRGRAKDVHLNEGRFEASGKKVVDTFQATAGPDPLIFRFGIQEKAK